MALFNNQEQIKEIYGLLIKEKDQHIASLRTEIDRLHAIIKDRDEKIDLLRNGFDLERTRTQADFELERKIWQEKISLAQERLMSLFGFNSQLVEKGQEILQNVDPAVIKGKRPMDRIMEKDRERELEELKEIELQEQLYFDQMMQGLNQE